MLKNLYSVRFLLLAFHINQKFAAQFYFGITNVKEMLCVIFAFEYTLVPVIMQRRAPAKSFSTVTFECL